MCLFNTYWFRLTISGIISVFQNPYTKKHYGIVLFFLDMILIPIFIYFVVP